MERLKPVWNESKILLISYKDHVTNEGVCAKIQQAIGPHEDLLTIVKRPKLKRHGHVSRSSGLAKTIFQGTLKGGRRQRQTDKEVGRQHQGMDRPGVRKVPVDSGEQRKNGGKWLRDHLWCTNDPRGQGIDEMMSYHTTHLKRTRQLFKKNAVYVSAHL